MPVDIQNYTPQTEVIRGKKRAVIVLGISGLVVGGWVLVILAAPITQANGLSGVAAPIYKFFSYLCHQMPERSLHIASHSLAVCSRCFGVYFGLLAGFLIYPLIRPIDEIEPFPRIWLFLSLIPIGIDWSLGMLGVYSNTHLSRLLTGTVLGIACAIFIIPALVELAQLLEHKKRRLLG